ncbi:hypothetical protein XhyaCFBP1156_01190 [Xanthomonas hyacinthi]|uniref:Uncharacterized protein n=1 Tax=Xanthomonas hyacinthi TaxID=56455 RepID=A0A2S7F347_9XANT|nr:hypothetical protein XhyaCFBP1156_01190 [Xanthomonas hyacinthi]
MLNPGSQFIQLLEFGAAARRRVLQVRRQLLHALALANPQAPRHGRRPPTPLPDPDACQSTSR